MIYYSLLTVENESSDSAIRVVRQYTRWRSPTGNKAPTDVVVNELAASRSVRMFTIDTSGQEAQMTKPDKFRRPECLPYFNILIATDGMISLYRVLCQRTIQEEISSKATDTLDSQATDATFTWVFSLKAQATHIGLCYSYLSYSTTTEAFLMHFSVEQVSLEDHSLTQICRTSIDALDVHRPRLQHHSLVLSSTSLLRVKEYNASRRSGTATPTLSRSNSLASLPSSPPPTPPTISHLAAQFTGPAGEPRGFASRSSSNSLLNNAGPTLTEASAVENSKHHFDIVFDRNNAVKNRAPYVELPLEISSKNPPQFIGAQGPSLGPAMGPTHGISANLGEIVGPHYDVHSYMVNTDEDFQLNSSQLLFYRNLGVAKSKLDSDFLVTSGSIAPSEVDAINSLSLTPVLKSLDGACAYGACSKDPAPSPSSSQYAYTGLTSSSSLDMSGDSIESSKKKSNSNNSSLAVHGVRMFIGGASQGYLWLFKRLNLCESVTYDWPSECHNTIVTEQFIYALTNNDTVLIAQMRHLDPIHSGPAYGALKGEAEPAGRASSGPNRIESKVPSKPTNSGPRETSDVLKMSSTVLVQQKTKPPLVGVLNYFGITHICAGAANGKMMILCKSTDDFVRQRRDASLLSLGNSRQQRGRSSSSLNNNASSTSSANTEGSNDSYPNKRDAAQGWNIVTAQFNGPQTIINQFKTWTSSDTLSKEDWDILVELWTFTLTVSRAFTSPRHTLETERWVSTNDYENALAERRAIYSVMAQLEFDEKRFTRAAIMWSLSDVPAEISTGKIMQKLKAGKKDAPGTRIAQDACVELLKRILLGHTQRKDLIESGSKGFEDVVYAILVHQNASLVGQVVLESPLSNFELDTTIILLEQTMASLEKKTSAAEVAQSFLSSALVLDLDGEVENSSPLDDFLRMQTTEEKQLWMTTLALVVLLLRRDENEQAQPAKQGNSFKGLLSTMTPDEYLQKLPDAFLVPYLATHSHLLFDPQSSRMESENADKNSKSQMLDSSVSSSSDIASIMRPVDRELKPSRLAQLMALALPWVTLEILAVGGPELFPPSFATSLLSGIGFSFSWMPNAEPIAPNFSSMNNNTMDEIELSGSFENSASSSSAANQNEMKNTVNPISRELNPALITTYYEALVLPTLNPAPKNGSGVLTSAGMPSQSLSTFGSSPLKRNPGTNTGNGSNIAVKLPDLTFVKALASRYLALAQMSAVDVANMLAYSTSDLIMRTNPHNTNPPLSLEGIWKEFHHEYLLEARHKFITGVLPVLPPPKGPLSMQAPPEWFYVIKLHGLICSLTTISQNVPQFLSPLTNIANHIMAETKRASLPERVEESIVLLCQPILGAFEDTVLQLTLLHPSTLIKFLKRYLPMNDLGKWKITLQVLLAQIAKNETNETVWCLQETLTYMARKLPSADFLNLLPDNGNVAFFIPYIELNLGRNASMNLLTEIQALK